VQLKSPSLCDGFQIVDSPFPGPHLSLLLGQLLGTAPVDHHKGCRGYDDGDGRVRRDNSLHKFGESREEGSHRIPYFTFRYLVGHRVEVIVHLRGEVEVQVPGRIKEAPVIPGDVVPPRFRSHPARVGLSYWVIVRVCIWLKRLGEVGVDGDELSELRVVVAIDEVDEPVGVGVATSLADIYELGLLNVLLRSVGERPVGGP
jgi:hypothetical protein